MYSLKNNQFNRNAKKYNSLYLNQFIQLKCGIDLLSLGLFPNAKEITESFAAYEATMNYLPFHPKYDKVNVVAVGDGHKPRTAATFAFRTSWNCYSVDPELIIGERLDRVKRLKCFKSKVEDIQLEFDEPTIIVCVHNHAKLKECVKSIRSPDRWIISMPCCFKDNFGIPTICYKDNNVWSEKNFVNIYEV